MLRIRARRPSRPVLTAVGAVAVILIGSIAATTVATHRMPATVTVAGILGLPPISSAQAYNLAPATRTIRPVTVTDSTGLLADYVSASSLISEQSAHGLRTVGSGSSVATVDGTAVRRSGTSPDASFSYLLHGSGKGAQTVRVEEAGSASSSYDVLVGTTTLHQRRPTAADYAFGGRAIGMVHYALTVPAAAIAADGTYRLTFRNTATPGDGAQIAGVWDSAATGAAQAPFGGSVTNPKGASGTGTTVLKSDIFGAPYVIYDFGKDVAGTVSLDVDNRAGSPKIGVAFSESIQFLTTQSDFSQDPSGVATETHFFQPAAGRSTINDSVIRGGFRYLMLYLAAPGELSVSNLALHFTGDPDNPDLRNYKGAFFSSDTTLNKLWYSGAYTTQLSTIASNTGRPYPAQPGPVANDVTVAKGTSFLSDGAKRDRLDWGGDNGISGPVALLTTGRGEAVQNSIEWFGDHPFPNGQIPGVYLPAPAGFQSAWGEYAAWWVHNYWTYYLYTGDRAFLDSYYSAMKGNLAWFATQVGADHLWDVSGATSGHWGYGQSGKETYDNAVYTMALRDAAAAAAVEEDTSAASSYTTRATQTAAAVNATLWDDTAGAYLVLPGSTAHPLDGNTMAVVAGIATGDRATRALAFVHKTLGTPLGELNVDSTDNNNVSNVISPFVSYQELLADSALGTAAGDTQAMSDLRRTWAHMLTGDTTSTLWETVSPSGGLGLGSYTSMAHGWGTGPTAYLTNQLLGVTPTSGGFASFQVAPRPAGGVTWAQGTVPTPRGPIGAGWRQHGQSFQIAVTAPAGSSYRIVLPDGTGTVVVGGATVFEAGHAVTGSSSGTVRRSGGDLVLEGLHGTTDITTS
ncbi:hypothetical protein ABIB25_003160 [Nakamurella sp. UYEF19]|uniref:alpha-L-rhamnosidase-related protein n=1 Tax=Nakamurella sp. UYEF19 TaxID=1756392 RepID=UPI00339A8BCC